MLNDELERRCGRNPYYSLRAFARDLGMSPPRLSNILNGKHGLSVSAAREVSRHLGWSAVEADEFCDMAESNSARNPLRKSAALMRLEKRRNSRRLQAIDADAFRVISDWYHLAILELMQINSYEDDPAWIARRLGISVHETLGALRRLERLEAIKFQDGRRVPTQDFFINPAGVPSECVRKFHRQVMERAGRSLDLQSTETRENTTLILTLRGPDLVAARKAIRDFRDSFNTRFGSPGIDKDQVFALGIQFFSLLEKPIAPAMENKGENIS